MLKTNEKRGYYIPTIVEIFNGVETLIEPKSKINQCNSLLKTKNRQVKPLPPLMSTLTIVMEKLELLREQNLT